MAVDNNPHIPEILSITQMAQLLNLSRSRLYQLTNENIFLPPIYGASEKSKRPYYTAELAQRNIEVKRNNVGVNGKICMFYSSRNNSPLLTHKKKSKGNKSINDFTEDNHQDLREGLAALGLSNVSDGQIESALKKSFPQGIGNIEQGEILKAVFLSIKRQNTEHNL